MKTCVAMRKEFHCKICTNGEYAPVAEYSVNCLIPRGSQEDVARTGRLQDFKASLGPGYV